MTPAEELKEIAAGLMRRVDITADSLPTPQTQQFGVWAKSLLAIAERLEGKMAYVCPVCGGEIILTIPMLHIRTLDRITGVAGKSHTEERWTAEPSCHNCVECQAAVIVTANGVELLRGE